MGSETAPLEYVLPNNASESSRLDLQHILLTQTFKGLHRAPLDPTKTHRVLDIGCGTGTWAIDFATQYPEAQVVGFDVQEKGFWKSAPPNCTFHVLDLEDPQTWTSLGSFDYIHSRFIIIGVRDWPGLVKRCHAHLVPSGHLELQEFCMPCQSLDAEKDQETSEFIKWGNQMMFMGEKVGLNLQVMNDMPRLMTEVGFRDVKMDDFRMMTGPWSDDGEGRVLGSMGQQNLAQGMRGFGETLCKKVLGWSDEKYTRWVEGIVREIEEGKLRTWLPVRTCCARKKE